MHGFGAYYAGAYITSIHSSSNTLFLNRVGGDGENPGCPQAKKHSGQDASSWSGQHTATDRRLHSHSHLRSISNARVRLSPQHTPVVCGRGPGRTNADTGRICKRHTEQPTMAYLWHKIAIRQLRSQTFIFKTGQHSEKIKFSFWNVQKNKIKRPLCGCFRPWMRQQAWLTLAAFCFCWRWWC